MAARRCQNTAARAGDPCPPASIGAADLYLSVMLPTRVRKVICYVVHDGELLIFRHRDHPDAGVQVPAGTVAIGEAPAPAAVREAEEETGKRGFALIRELGVYDHKFRETFRGVERHEMHERHVFLLAPPPDLPERWSHFAEPESGGFWFEFFWVPLVPELRLAGDQHALSRA